MHRNRQCYFLCHYIEHLLKQFLNVVTAEDVQGNENETGFKDLVKFWKKHGIPIAKDLLSDMDEETGKKHGIPIAKELLSDMAEETGKKHGIPIAKDLLSDMDEKTGKKHGIPIAKDLLSDMD